MSTDALSPLSAARIGAARVLVVGDVMLDRYWYGAVDRISPEAPVPVVRVTREEERGGGAANVALNVAALGAQATLLTVVGEDEASHKLEKLLAQTGLRIGDFDVIELNEAFAAQACAVNQAMGWDTSKVNVNGGAIAIGHPIGASGCRILVTLLHEMGRRGAKKGIASLCIGGGMGVALTIER